MKRRFIQLIIAIVLFTITSYVVALLVKSGGVEPAIGFPIPFIEIQEVRPDCEQGKICILIIYTKAVFRWHFLIVNIALWWVGVMALQYFVKKKKRKKKKVKSSQNFKLPQLKLKFSKQQQKLLLIIVGLVVISILAYTSIVGLSNKGRGLTCGGFTGASCSVGYICTDKPNYPDALGNCTFFIEAMLYRR